MHAKWINFKLLIYLFLEKNLHPTSNMLLEIQRNVHLDVNEQDVWYWNWYQLPFGAFHHIQRKLLNIQHWSLEQYFKTKLLTWMKMSKRYWRLYIASHSLEQTIKMKTTRPAALLIVVLWKILFDFILVNFI